MPRKTQQPPNTLTTEPEILNAIAAELAGLAGIDNPATWTPAALLQAIRSAKEQRRANTINRRIDLAGINWHTERETFLNYARSPHTRRAYAASLEKLENWASKKNVKPLELTPAEADQFIHGLKAQGKAPATTHRDIAAASSFYAFLERSTQGKIKNPLRGTRQRPQKENKKETIIPTAADYARILAELPPIERAIVETLAQRGLRAGALPTLELKGKKYHGKSKGKPLKENSKAGITLPPEALAAIEAAGLSPKKPFAWKTRQGTIMNASAIQRRINKHMGKLCQEGKIRAPYSCHDFRHFFAVSQYEKTKDIYQVSQLLNHETIGITQAYLKSLDLKLT